MQGIWEIVLLTEFSNLGKPGVFDVMVENIDPMLEEDIARA